MANYAKIIPRDTSGVAMDGYPAASRANVTRMSENCVASSVVTLHHDTSTLEIGAFGGQGLVFRWVPTSETAAVAPRASVVASGAGANYDHYIPSGNYRRFVVPKESAGKTAGNVGSINGLFNRVAVINAGPTAASVLYMEY
jgi:hypothetical protein